VAGRVCAISDPAVSGVLTVQCGLGWLRPGAWELRDEIDSAIMPAVLVRGDLMVDRIVLHSLPSSATSRPVNSRR